MQVFIGHFRPEKRVLLRRLDRVELPHDRLRDPIGALQHPPRVVRVVTATEIGVTVARPRRRAAGFQDFHLVEVAGDLDARFRGQRSGIRPSAPATTATTTVSYRPGFSVRFFTIRGVTPMAAARQAAADLHLLGTSTAVRRLGAGDVSPAVRHRDDLSAVASGPDPDLEARRIVQIEYIGTRGGAYREHPRKR